MHFEQVAGLHVIEGLQKLILPLEGGVISRMVD